MQFFWRIVRDERTLRRNLRVLLTLSFVLALVVPLVANRVTEVAGAGVTPTAGTASIAGAAGGAANRRTPLTGDAVTVAFRASRLPMIDLRQEPVTQRGPSGAPVTEREVWAFRVPGVEPSGGRILVFADDAALQQKADWFRRVGAEPYITIYGNVILWLDPGLSPQETGRYRAALTRL